MPSSIGGCLKELRMARGVSLRGLALKAGVSARAISYWESGAFQPRAPELEAVLSALGASEAERAAAWARLDAPRGREHQRVSMVSGPPPASLGPPISSGDLIRALRMRRGLSMEHAAAMASVSLGTLSRWENGAPPPADVLDRLLVVLAARPEERSALANGTFLATPTPVEDISLDAEWQAFHDFSAEIFGAIEDPLQDLRFLTFAARAWPHAAHGSESARELLADVWARHAAYLSSFHRYREAGRQANRALELLADARTERRPGPSTWRAIIVAAKSTVYRTQRPAPRQGLSALRQWLPEDGTYRAWMLAEMAEYTAMDGNAALALELAHNALESARATGDGPEIRLRRMDLAFNQLRAGQPEAALSNIVPRAEDTPFRRASVHLLWSECQLAAGDAASAAQSLQTAQADIKASNLRHFEPRMNALAKRLA